MTLVNHLYVPFALLAAACFYISVPHQRLVPSRPQHTVLLRVTACALLIVSVATAAIVLGVWAGSYAALTALMLGCVLLPYVDAWRAQRNRSHVG